MTFSIDTVKAILQKEKANPKDEAYPAVNSISLKPGICGY